MVEYNPYDRVTQANPYPTYARLRDEAPVYHNAAMGFWALSRFDDVLVAHLDPETFISGEGTTLERLSQGGTNLVDTDEPDHGPHRSGLVRMFTPRAVSALEPWIRESTRSMIDDALPAGRLDVIDDLSVRLPMYVICELLGIAEEHRDPIRILSKRILAAGEITDTPVQSDDSVAAFGELFERIAAVIADHRATPRDDLITRMLETEFVDRAGEAFFLDDLTAMHRVIEFAIAGHETTAKLVGSGVVALAWNPDQRGQLAADPALIPQAVEEMLRWDPPSHIQARTLTRPVELHGTTIPEGSRVALLTAAANHDDRVFADPAVFDIHRRFERHVAFGYGIHLCLGAALARLESRIVFEELLAVVPDYELDEDGIVRAYTTAVRGLEHLPIVFEPRPPRS